MGQSWERARAGQGQQPQRLSSLTGRTANAFRPSFPALAQTPWEEASTISHLSAPFCSQRHPYFGFLEKPPNQPHQPQTAGPAQQWGKSVWLSGISRCGSVSSHILGLVTQCPTPIHSLLAADSGHPAACADSASVRPAQRAASRFPQEPLSSPLLVSPETQS